MSTPLRPRPYQRPVGPRTGFTMIELLVVMLILTTLVAMVIGVGRYLSQEQDRKLTQSYQKVIMTAIQKYYDRTGHVPENPNDPSPYPNPVSAEGQEVGRPEGMTDSQWDTYARNALMYAALESQSECIAIIKKLPQNVILKGQQASGEPPAFIDAYGKYMDYRETGGYGGPLLVSGGPDRYIGGEHVADDIRSDGRTLQQ